MTKNSIVRIVIAVVVGLAGWLGMRVCGFAFAPDAGNLFMAKLPVFLLVALLVERTAEIFLTIWRGGDSVNMQKQLESLTALKKSARTRTARLEELPGEIEECDKAIAKLTADPGKQAKLENKKTALETKKADLEKATGKEDDEIDELEEAKLKNQKVGTFENRTQELADYKNETRSRAFAFNFVLALCIAACGFRAIEGLVIIRPIDEPGSIVLATFDETRLEALTTDLKAKITSDRARLEKVTDPEKRKPIKEKLDEGLAPWLEENLRDVMVKASVRRQIGWFRFFDILLTAGLLAGGADPISRIMKLLRDILDKSSKKAGAAGS